MNEYSESIIEAFLDDVRHCDMYSPEGILITDARRSEEPNLCLHIKDDAGIVWELTKVAAISFITNCTFKED